MLNLLIDYKHSRKKLAPVIPVEDPASSKVTSETPQAPATGASLWSKKYGYQFRRRKCGNG